MILTIYKEALNVLTQKPIRLWGISLLSGVLAFIGSTLFGLIPGVGLAIGLLLSTGMTMVYLHGFRGEEVQSVQLFDCCKDWKTIGRVLGGMGWMALWVFLWGLIPIVGIVFAVIKVYAWRLTPYILVQEPEVPVTQAIKVSEARTEGYKGRMFGADILPMLAFYAAIAILALLSGLPFIGWLFALAAVLVGIAFVLFIGLFKGLVKSGFYEKISGKSNPSASAHCPDCGAEYVPGVDAFCGNCGKKFGE